MQKKCKLPQIVTIPYLLLPLVNGGQDENSLPTITVNASGNESGLGGTIVSNVPVGPGIIYPYVSVDSINGMTGFGFSFKIPYH